MPPSIDPKLNFFDTGSSVFKRLFLFVVAGGIGDFLSSLTELIFYALDPEFFAELARSVLVSFLMWPWNAVGYMSDAPVYALILMVSLAFFFCTVVFSDGPVLFWFVSMITFLTLGSFFASPEWIEPIPLTILLVGLGSALWCAVSLEHPEWVDRFRTWTGI